MRPRKFFFAGKVPLEVKQPKDKVRLVLSKGSSKRRFSKVCLFFEDFTNNSYAFMCQADVKIS